MTAVLSSICALGFVAILVAGVYERRQIILQRYAAKNEKQSLEHDEVTL